MTDPIGVISRLSTTERQSWSYDSPIGATSPTTSRPTPRRVCTAVTVLNLNTAGTTSPRPPQNPAAAGPLETDMLPVRLTHADGRWLATGRFTHPAVLDPELEAVLDQGIDYLLALDGQQIVVAAADQP